MGIDSSDPDIKGSHIEDCSGNVTMIFGASDKSELLKVVQEELPANASDPNHHLADLNKFASNYGLLEN